MDTDGLTREGESLEGLCDKMLFRNEETGTTIALIKCAKGTGIPVSHEHASNQFGHTKGLISMAITYGDTWTNLLQPFGALPALALAGLGIRGIMGYCITAMFVSGIVAGPLLTVLPLIF